MEFGLELKSLTRPVGPPFVYTLPDVVLQELENINRDARPPASDGARPHWDCAAWTCLRISAPAVTERSTVGFASVI